MNISAIFVLPFLTPWYVASPLVTYLLSLFTTSAPCPLTRLEDKIRIKMGKPPIKHFIGYYFVWPLKRKFGRKAHGRGN